MAYRRWKPSSSDPERGTGANRGCLPGMRDLTELSNGLDRDAGTCVAIIETPKGRRGKYDYDRETGLFRLANLLPEGMSFPLDFGFIPSTLCDDGDPLDVMVLSDEPSPVGALVEVKLIGVLEAEEKEHGKVERNDRLLAIPVASHLYAGISTVDDLEPSFIRYLSEFWINKAKLEGKTFRVLKVSEPAAAIALVRQTAKVAKNKQ
jgi:inorganic pyrophosphatase